MLLLAWWWRLEPLLDNRFHADEALYGYWGLLIGRGVDPLLATVPVYKPPLLPYLIAGAQLLFGNSEFVVRLPGLASGWLMIPLTAALARALYSDRGVSLASAVGVAMSPFAILFSATAFTDLPMVVLGMAALLAAARDRPTWAGLFVGLACSAKQTGLAWLPPVLGLYLAFRSGEGWGRLLLGLLLPLTAVAAWDMARMAAGGRSFWEMGVSGYGGLRLIWPVELWPRLREWVRVGRYLFVSPPVWFWLLAGLPLLAWRAIRSGPAPSAWADLVLLSFTLAYGLFHWLVAFPVWDRYLLPVLPVLAVLLGRVVVRPRVRRVGAAVLLLAALLLPVTVLASRSHYPVGGDHGAYDGIEQVSDFLRRRPAGSVVYQHWLGWHYDYYLFGAQIYISYWPTPAWLAQDVRAFGSREPRYIVFPSWESSARVERMLADVEYRLMPVLTTVRRDGSVSFRVFRIVPVLQNITCRG